MGSIVHCPINDEFTQADVWTIKAGSLLNVGWAAPLFGRPRRRFQAELLYGESPPAVRQLAGVTSRHPLRPARL